MQEAILPLFFKDLNSLDVFQVGLVSGLGFLHTVTTRDSKRGGKGTGSSGTLLMTWGLRLCWEAPPVWSPSPSRGRCPQTAPIAPPPPGDRALAVAGPQGPAQLVAPGTRSAATAQGHPARQVWGQPAHPQGHPCQGLTPQPRGDTHTQMQVLILICIIPFFIIYW